MLKHTLTVLFNLLHKIFNNFPDQYDRQSSPPLNVSDTFSWPAAVGVLFQQLHKPHGIDIALQDGITVY